MPITGKVLEVNPALEAHPEKVNSDPYGEGWMIKIEVKGTPEWPAYGERIQRTYWKIRPLMDCRF